MAEIPCIVAFAVARIARALARKTAKTGAVGAKDPRRTGDENIAQSQRRMSTFENTGLTDK